MSKKSRREHRPEMMREADQDFVSDLQRRVARLEDLAVDFRGDLLQLEIARQNHEERLSNNRKRIVAFQRCVDELTSQEGHVEDRSAHARLDRLWRFATATNERLIEVEHRLDVPDNLADKLTNQFISLMGRVDELERRVAVMHRDVAGLKQASGPEALPVTLDRLTKCEKQIARLQEILKAVFRALPAEYA